MLVSWTGLKEDDARAVGAQSIGEDAAGRTRADNGVIALDDIVHSPISCLALRGDAVQAGNSNNGSGPPRTVVRMNMRASSRG